MQMNSSMPGDHTSNRSILSDPRLILTDDPATPIHTSFAKVYTMNPSNKVWLPATKTAVPVSFYFDKHRSVYRIISYEGSNLIINSTVAPTMNFLKTSSTFGLWSDAKLRTIFGLGFVNQTYRDQISDWFDKVVKAAAALEQCLPLPPPANTAVSVSFGDTGWPKEHGCDTNANHDFIPPPQTVHVVDSSLNLSDHVNRHDHYEKLEEYHLDGQTGTTEMAQLALQNLQYERELSKAKKLESDLTTMGSTLSSLHVTLQKKITDGDNLKKEISELKEELQTQTKRADDAEKRLEEEKATVLSLTEEIDSLKASMEEKDAAASEQKTQHDELKKENEILKERLRHTTNELDQSDKSWDFVDMACCELSDKIQGLMDIQKRLKRSVPAPPRSSES